MLALRLSTSSSVYGVLFICFFLFSSFSISITLLRSKCYRTEHQSVGWFDVTKRWEVLAMGVVFSMLVLHFPYSFHYFDDYGCHCSLLLCWTFFIAFFSLSPFLSFLYHQHILHFSLILYLLLSTNVISLQLVPFRTIEEAERWKYNNSQNKRRQTAIGTKKIASLRKITEQKERDRANDIQNEFDVKNGKYFVKYFEPRKNAIHKNIDKM